MLPKAWRYPSQHHLGVTLRWKRSHHSGDISPEVKKARQVHSNIRVMLTIFFELHNVVHHMYTSQRQKNYQSASWRSTVALVMLYNANDWTCAQQTLGSSIMTMYPSVLQSDSDYLGQTRFLWFISLPTPYIAPCSFWLFPKLKISLKGMWFET